MDDGNRLMANAIGSPDGRRLLHAAGSYDIDYILAGETRVYYRPVLQSNPGGDTGDDTEPHGGPETDDADALRSSRSGRYGKGDDKPPPPKPPPKPTGPLPGIS
ncbi:hypothetical protein PV04_05895 [Phialophora macrospora]|uniref:Uncharacterized protein n=1 Tax=Phialophora macrospora TaxID=1851006 RepID=A0A0D2FIK7_9EURO|nr:hypothetical protein PV04_05895 [Phialophora macrospora]